MSQSFESNLPIISINTYGNDILDDPRIIADMGIINNLNKINKLSDDFNNYNGKISIETREVHLKIYFQKNRIV